MSRSGAFGYVQCLYLKKPNRGCLRAIDPEWHWAYPIFSPREIFPPLEALVSLAKSSPHFPSLQGWVDGSSMALKMKLPLSLNTPSPAASPVAGKEKKTFSPSGLRPTLPDKGALIQRGGLLLGASLSLQIPGSQRPLQLTGNWIHE